MGRLGPFEENTIVVGDCLDVMAQMPDGCVDLVVIDPPFDIEELDYEQFFVRCADTMKEGATIYCYWSSKGITFLEPLFRQAFHLRNIIAIRTKNFICHPWDKAAFDFKWTPVFFGTKGQLNYELRKKAFAEDYHTGDAWNCVMPQSNWVQEKRIHRFQKPEESIERMIRISSSPGDLIFDPFIGSGTTAVVADRLGRKFFGCDINPDYVEMALERLEKDRAGRQLVLL